MHVAPGDRRRASPAGDRQLNSYMLPQIVAVGLPIAVWVLLYMAPNMYDLLQQLRERLEEEQQLKQQHNQQHNQQLNHDVDDGACPSVLAYAESHRATRCNHDVAKQARARTAYRLDAH
jgi:hypothetical protein